MQFQFWGTRGSVPVSGKQYERYGGNTTCLRVLSDCIPGEDWLVIDAGSGIIPLSQQALAAKVQNLRILFTHWHHDHTQGLLLTPQLYIPGKKLYLYGPIEHKVGPLAMLRHLMVPPFHPVSHQRVTQDIVQKGISNPSGMVIVVHPEGGFVLLTVAELAKLDSRTPSQVKMGNGGKYPLDKCLVIRMLYSNHPEYTISYRFEERTSGQVYVLLTDHENTDGLPSGMADHLKNADLLVMDSQYKREVYDTRTAGFGHGTPDYCVVAAKRVGAKRLGLTHHDPFSSDEAVDEILANARAHAEQIGYTGEVFACADYQTA